MSLVGWLFWVYRPFETVFQSISGRLPKRLRRKKGQLGVKMSKQPPPAPNASAIGPCPTIIQISRTPWHWKFTQDHRTTRPPTKWCHTHVEATPTSTSVGRHFGFMCLLASERLTYHKNCISKSLFPPKIPLSWLLNGGCHCSPLKYCSKGPNIASHPTIHKCSGVQINLNLKRQTKTISNLHLYIDPSILPVSQTYTINPSI